MDCPVVVLDSQHEWTGDSSYSWCHDLTKMRAIIIIIAFFEFFLWARHYAKCIVPVFSFNLHDKPMGRVSINWNVFGCNEQLKTRKFIILRSVEMVTSSLLEVFIQMSLSQGTLSGHPFSHSPSNISCSPLCSFLTTLFSFFLLLFIVRPHSWTLRLMRPCDGLVRSCMALRIIS